MQTQIPEGLLPVGFGFIAIVILGLTVIVHFACMVAIATDGSDIEKKHGRTELIGLWTWTVAALLGGIFTLALYWMMHHSTFHPRNAAVRTADVE